MERSGTALYIVLTLEQYMSSFNYIMLSNKVLQLNIYIEKCVCVCV